MKELSIDLETYSDIDISKCGAYRYAESDNFEILLFGVSLLCKWFRIAVLPADKELYAELCHTEDMRRCSVCGAPFVSSSNRAVYCPDCRKRITRRQTAERMRKMRANVTR